MTEAHTLPHARMVHLLQQLAPTEGYVQTLLDGVTLMRANQPIAVTPALYEPGIVIIVQGRKRGFHGGQQYVYDAQHYLVLSVPLPFSIETEASPVAPLLGMALRIDPAQTAQLALEMAEDAVQPAPSPPAQPATLYASPMDDRLQDAALRLLEVLCSPQEARLLGPAIVHEISYRVLTGAQGANLRAALQPGSHLGRIAKVLHHIHGHYAQRLDVAQLAQSVHWSAPAFHVHFKAVTATSPLQYIKALRLHQARLLMVRQALNAATACEQVGYESPSQFSREFKRLFGRTPMEETRAMQALMALGAPVRMAVQSRGGVEQ